MNPEQQNGQYQGMPPAQIPTPSGMPPNGNPYDFIMNPQKPAKPPLKLLPTGNSTLQRVAIFGGGIVILMMLIVIFGSVITKGGQKGTADLITVAQDQTELARIANDGTQNATSQATQNLANNVLASMTSARVDTITYLKNGHHKVGNKTLAAKHEAATDTTLANAKEAGTYDTTFNGIIQQDLSAYAQALKKAFDAKPGPKGEAMLNSQFEAAKLLNQQSQQH